MKINFQYIYRQDLNLQRCKFTSATLNTKDQIHNNSFTLDGPRNIAGSCLMGSTELESLEQRRHLNRVGWQLSGLNPIKHEAWHEKKHTGRSRDSSETHFEPKPIPVVAAAEPVSDRRTRTEKNSPIKHQQKSLPLHVL